MSRLPSPFVVATLLAATVGPAAAKEDAPRPGALRPIESCVSRDSISFGRGDRSAVLDEADQRAVGTALLRLYPVVENDGMAPARLMLWQKRSGETLYVALLPNPQKPSEACFTATFAAAKVDMTLLLRRKYFSESAPHE